LNSKKQTIFIVKYDSLFFSQMRLVGFPGLEDAIWNACEPNVSRGLAVTFRRTIYPDSYILEDFEDIAFE